MWQDSVALLIVIVAALVLLRRYVPSTGLQQTAARRENAVVGKAVLSARACGSCGAQAGCGRVKHEHQGTG
jgi:membrane protein implicated in regulation of membrane protease activity